MRSVSRVASSFLAMSAAAWLLVPGVASARSPDQIAFQGFDGGIHVINPDGTGEQALTGGPWSDISPSWSPDRTQIVFASNRDDPNFDIFIMNADGSGQTNLTEQYGDSRELYPSWSPLGDRIAYCGDNGFGTESVWIMNLSDGSRHQVSGGTLNCHGVTWAPDGSRVAFSADYGTFHYDLWSVRTNGMDLRRITLTDDDEEWPDWSPDGRLIAYARYQSFFAVFTVTPRGGDVSRVGPRQSDDPSFAPDGSRIVYWEPFRDRIWVMNADGTGRRLLEDGVYPDW